MARHAQSAFRRLAPKALPLVILGAGVAIFIIAFVVSNTDDPENPVITGNPAIEELIPQPGSEVLRQSLVGIDLAPGYEAELVINGTPIPLDQVNLFRSEENPDESADLAGRFDETLSRFVYQPLAGRDVPALKADENIVVVEFWPTSDPDNVDRIEWRFTVN